MPNESPIFPTQSNYRAPKDAQMGTGRFQWDLFPPNPLQQPLILHMSTAPFREPKNLEIRIVEKVRPSFSKKTKNQLSTNSASSFSMNRPTQVWSPLKFLSKSNRMPENIFLEKTTTTHIYIYIYIQGLYRGLYRATQLSYVLMFLVFLIVFVGFYCLLFAKNGYLRLGVESNHLCHV